MEFRTRKERQPEGEARERQQNSTSKIGKVAFLALPALAGCASFAPPNNIQLTYEKGRQAFAETLFPERPNRNYYEIQAAAVSKAPERKLGVVFRPRKEDTDLFSGIWVNGRVQNRFYQFGLFSVSEKEVPGASKNGTSFVIGYEKWYKNYTVFPFDGVVSQIGFIPTKIREGDTVELDLSVGSGKVKMKMHDITTGEHKEYDFRDLGSEFSPGINRYGNFTGIMHETASFQKDINTDLSLKYRIVGGSGAFDLRSDQIKIVIDKLDKVGGGLDFKVHHINTDITACVRGGIFSLEKSGLSPK